MVAKLIRAVRPASPCSRAQTLIGSRRLAPLRRCGGSPQHRPERRQVELGQHRLDRQMPRRRHRQGGKTQPDQHQRLQRPRRRLAAQRDRHAGAALGRARPRQQLFQQVEHRLATADRSGPHSDGAPRSAANRNCSRSFEPTETKSASREQFRQLPHQRRHLQHRADRQPLGRGTDAPRLGQQQRARRRGTRPPSRPSGTSPTAGARRPPAAARATAGAAGRADPGRPAASASPWPDFPPPAASTRQQLVGAQVQRAEHAPAARRPRPARAHRSPPARPHRRSMPRASMAISVRNRPMPSAPVRRAAPVPGCRPTFSIRLTPRRRRAVAAGRSRNAAQPACCSASGPPAPGRRPARTSVSGRRMSWPSSASSTASSPGSAASSMPRVPPSAGMPSARARMAAWPAGLASSIATPAMPRRASPAVRPAQAAGRAGSRPAAPPAAALAGERGQQPAGQILDVGQPLAQIGIGDAAHAIVQFAGDTLHRRLGGQAAADHLGDAAQPAGIGGDQPIGLEHLARRGPPSAAWPSGRRRSARPALLHPLGRVVQPPSSAAGSRPAGARPGRRHAGRPVRWRCRRRAAHRRRPAARSRRPLRRHPPRRSPPAVRPAASRRSPVPPPPPRCRGAGAVLHREHAERAAGAADRDGEHRGERLLAGFRPIGEGGMVLRIGQVHHLRGGGAQPDDALADAQPGVADGLPGSGPAVATSSRMSPGRST